MIALLWILLFLVWRVVSASQSHVVELSQCDGPPYIYATTHHQVGNVLKFSRNGCLLEKHVLIGGHIKDEHHFTELRSLALGEHKGKEALFVADAMTSNSAVLIFGACDSHGRRLYVDTVVMTTKHNGAMHAYGVALDYDHNIYASFQHTDCVLRFKKESFEPMELPPALQNSHHWREFYPGTFAQFGNPTVHSKKQRGVRSIVFVKGNLWVANKDIGGIAVYSLETGVVGNIIVVKNAIGLHYDKEHNLVFVGSKAKHWRGAVYGIDPGTFTIVKTFTTGRMNHPTGITSFGNDLYVAEISQGVIYKFCIKSCAYVSTIVSDPPGELEQLIMSDC